MEIRAAVHALNNATRLREETGAEPGIICIPVVKGNSFLFKPVFQLVKGNRKIDTAGAVLFDLILFGDTRSNKNDVRVRILLLQKTCVRFHRRNDLRIIRKTFRMIFLDQPGNRVAAGRNYQLRSPVDQFFIPGLYDIGTNRCFKHLKKSQLFHCFRHRPESLCVKCRNKGRRKRCNDLFARIDQLLNKRYIVSDFLGVLGTYLNTAPTKNAVAADDRSLMIFYAD